MPLDFKLPRSFNGGKLADAIITSLDRLGGYKVARTDNNRSISINADSLSESLSFRVMLYSNASYSHLMLQGDSLQNGIQNSFATYLLEELAKQ
ncbi:hypothetical protein HYT23_01175 [Candidatus Pacearchaeota archaeon]|nr:hypothetical protein [Candidatus Pacearchaeota archaeon]